MGDATMWWILAGLLVGAELVSGTLYLLMLALGAATGGVVAWLGAGLIPQIVVAAVTGGAAVLAWYAHQRRRAVTPPETDAPPPGLGHLDVGEQVQVSHWHADGTARVHHRGSEWRARLADPHGAPQTGPHRIRAIERNLLVLEKI